uniref:Titin n=1 Tax=Falco tinnunculus TaxID=100819 RepID=A0A8C4UH07_FALTI
MVPQKLEVIDTTKSTVTLAWEKPLHDGGSRLTGYVIEASKAGTERWLKVVTLKPTVYEHTIISLNEGEQYLFRVRAQNQKGVSEPREIVTAVTVQDQKVLPTIDFAGIPQKTIHVPAGKPIELAIPIEGRPPPAASWFVAGSKLKESERIKIETVAKMAKLTVRETTIHDTGEYTLELKNTTGTVTDTLKVIILDKPGPPVGPIRIDEIDSNYVTISWEPPELDGGATLSGYVVEQRDAHRPGWLPVSESVTRTTFKFTRLVEGYRFRVLACNAGGPGEPAEVPGTEGLMVRQGGVIRLTIPIKGKPIPVCKWTKEGHDISKRAMIATSDTHTELVIKDAEREDSGTYDLALENKCGKKAVYIKVRVIGIPNPPEGPLEYDDIQARSVRVSWRPPTDDGGADILGYIVERREVPKTAWYTVDSRVKGTSLVVKGLKENVEYHFRVSAENHFGISKSLKSEEPARHLQKNGCGIIRHRLQLQCTQSQDLFQMLSINSVSLLKMTLVKVKQVLRKYKMSSDGRNHTLTVITDEQEDEGLYTCMATNDVGEIETSFISCCHEASIW